MKNMHSKLTYANVMVTILAFVVLAGGTAFASETLLPKNSVGTKQLKPGAVTPAKLSKTTKTALTGKEGPAGPKGDRGAQGPTGPTGLPGPEGGHEPLAVDASGEVADVRTGSSITLESTTSWTSRPGQVGLLLGNMTATLATESGGFGVCFVTVNVFDNGAQVTSFFVQAGLSGSFEEKSASLSPAAVAIDEPGDHTITAKFESAECKAGSKIDRLTLLVAPQGV
jgi:hypothetical protein